MDTLAARLRLSPSAFRTLGVVVVGVALTYVAYGLYGFRTTAVLAFMVRYSTPLILAALCGTIGERSGVINIGIEGQMLMAAFLAFLTASWIGVWLGIVGGIVVGAAMGAFLALCAVTWRIDQIIAGTVVNILAAGLTSFFYRQGKTIKGSLDAIEIPLLKDIPVFGEVFFSSKPIAYLAIIAVIVCQVMLFRTPWGLRTRAVGEHPSAADTVGVNVNLYRYRNMMIAGGLAGLAGAYISLEGTGAFERGMTAGRGFLALAIMIMGRWKPSLAWAAALFFGLLQGLVNQLNFDKVIDIPPQFIGMLPYALTIVVLAIFAGRVRPPAAAGTPYTKE